MSDEFIHGDVAPITVGEAQVLMRTMLGGRVVQELLDGSLGEGGMPLRARGTGGIAQAFGEALPM